jgi:hypothetical protein
MTKPGEIGRLCALCQYTNIWQASLAVEDRKRDGRGSVQNLRFASSILAIGGTNKELRPG